MINKPTAGMRRRLFGLVSIGIVFLAVAIVVNLFTIAIKDNQKYQELANNQQFASRIINANRGSILDSNGTVLAQSATVYNVFIDPGTLKENDLKKKDLIVNTLSEILGVEKDYINDRIEKNTGYEIIKRKVEKPIADKVTKFVSDNKLACIGCDPDTQRFYPQNDLASSVIGFTGFDGHGQYGLEQYYDKYLTGIDGKIISAEDAMGQQMPYRYEQSFAAQDGNNLILNIDSNIQYIVETELAKAVSSFAPKNRACAIVMNPKTGQILAMSTQNDFDLNEPTKIEDPATLKFLKKFTGDEYDKQYKIAREKQWKNKAITELYNPGSVFKPITGASAIEEKVIDPYKTTFNCSGSMTIGGENIHCWKLAGHGSQHFYEALSNSCNPAFMQIGLKLGIHNFSNYYNAFGFTEPTGIDLPNEAQSIYIKEENMTELDLAVSSFGQSHKITPIQMITALAAVVNGGKLVTPYVANRIEDQNGNVIKQFEPVIKRQVISEETSKIMRGALENVVNKNGEKNAYISGYKIGGKSGTSQKIDEYGREIGSHIYVGSFMAFAPADDPDMIMLCIVDEPTGSTYYGSLVAAPAVREVFDKVLPYLGHFKEYTADELEKLNVTVPDLTGKTFDSAAATLTQLGLVSKRVSSGSDKVVKQVPEFGNSVPKGGTVYLYSESSDVTMVTVPDVRKFSLQDANTILVNAGLNILPKGGAVDHAGALASEQTHCGEKVPKGTVIEVSFLAYDAAE